MKKTVEGLVISNSTKCSAFFVLLDKRFFDYQEVKVDYRFCPRGEDLVGRWVKLVIDDRFNACEPVIDMRSPFETRIDKRGHPEVKVKVQHVGCFQYRFQAFYNETFGGVLDFKSRMPKVVENGWYNVWIGRIRPGPSNAHWRIASLQDSVNPIVTPPTSPVPNKYGSEELRMATGMSHSHDGENELGKRSNQSPESSVSTHHSLQPSVPHLEDDRRRREEHIGGLIAMEGIVTGHATRSRSYLAVGLFKPGSTICIDYELCPENVDLVGKWVEMKVDRWNRVRKPVTLIRDVFPTQIDRGRVLIRCEFQHVSTEDHNVFYNNKLGNIYDVSMAINARERNAWYSAWLEVYLKKPLAWKIAMYGHIEGPLNKDNSNFPSYGTERRESGYGPDELENFSRKESRRHSPDGNSSSKSGFNRYLSGRSRSVSPDPRSDHASSSNERRQYRIPSPDFSPDPRPERQFDRRSEDNYDYRTFPRDIPPLDRRDHTFDHRTPLQASSNDHEQGTSSQPAPEPKKFVFPQKSSSNLWNPHKAAQKVRDKMTTSESIAGATEPSEVQVEKLQRDLSRLQLLINSFVHDPEVAKKMTSVDPMFFELLQKQLKN